MKTISIGDIHGQTIWKMFADLRQLTDTPNLSTEYDKYIFLGDYVDSFTETNLMILHNLKEIIQLKKNYPDKVVLLIGNHDLQYMFGYDGHGCSGYRPEAANDLTTLFRANLDLFQPILQIDKYIWSHAGIHEGWWNMQFKGNDTDSIESQIREAFYTSCNDAIYDVGHLRGGSKQVGGIFWADKRMTGRKPLKGYHQIVGHTPVKEIMTEQKDNDTSITYCDTLERGNKMYHELEFGS